MLHLFDDYQINEEETLVDILKPYPPNTPLATLAEFLSYCAEEDEENEDTEIFLDL